MKIKAILLDMDGTLLLKDQVNISARCMEAIDRAAKKGIQIIPCTGRVLDMYPPQLLKYENMRYRLTCHGARVVDMKTGESIYENLVSPENSAKVFKLFEGRGIYGEIAAEGTIYLEKEIADHLENYPVPKHHLWYTDAGIPKGVECPSEYFAKNGIGMEKVNLYGIKPEDRQPLYDALEELGVTEFTRPGAKEDIEFLPKGIDKLEALGSIFERINVGFDEILAIGDSSSDERIIESSAVGVAMGNAPDWLKEKADYITETNEDDGVALAIEKFCEV